MPYNPSILRELLRARSLSPTELSKRIGITPTQLENELAREPEPKQKLLNSIAHELAVPVFTFYRQRAPELHDIIPDFRSVRPAPSAKARETIEAIQFGAGVQQVAVSGEAPGASRDLPRLEASQTDKVGAFALAARKFFEISEHDQANAKDAREFYVLCRKKIEEKGIFVVHASFPADDGSGFCLAHRSHPLILINTKRQTRGRRLFTLAHELAHVLMRETGISDPFVRENATERLCNRFAGAFLVPKSYVKGLLGSAGVIDQPDMDDVRWASRRLKISQEATVLRLEQLGFYKPGSYKNWKSIVSSGANPDYSETGGGGTEPPPQEKVKLAKYGFHFAEAFSWLLQKGRTDGLNIYRSTGLKPKYQRSYFEYANSITTQNLRDAEVDDE